MSSSSSTQKLHPIIAAADVDDGWSLEAEHPLGSTDPNAETRKLRSMPRLATPISEDAGDFPLARALPKPALGSPLPRISKKRETSAGSATSTGKLETSAGSATSTGKRETSAGSDISTGERNIISAADTVPLSASGAGVPSYWSEARLPRPMGELAQGTAPEHPAPTELRKPATTTPAPATPVRQPAESVPAPWATANQEIKSQAQENPAGFDDIDRAFFAEGEELANTKQTVDEFVDLANDTLTFWQRLWKR